MISCNRCGNMSPASAVNCQTCGAPLVSKIEAGFGPARTFQDQPELPAWLESLRAGERSAAPADNPANFSPADLIEEGSLPSWMRSGRPEAGMSGAYPKLRPSSLPGPNTDDSKGINAKSLIDEQSLPSWMQEGGTQQPTGSIPQNGIPASSLLQQDAAPDWMRSLQSQQLATSNPALPTVPPMSPPPSAFPAQPGFPGATGSPMRPAQGFSAGDLVDQQSLPSWMKEDKGSSVPTRSASGGLSSSSLLDPNSMPPWLRENAQQEQRNAGMPPAPTNQSWQSAPSPMGGPPLQQSPVWQPQAPNNAPAQGNSLAASSFIDPNALPSWLRSGSEQSYQPGGMPPQQPAGNPRAGYGVPPRVENMRVPSRPRGEINSNENNEAAANVFASMLGVASATPNFPATPPIQSYGMPGSPMSPMSPMQNMPPGANMPGQPPVSAPLGYNGSQGLQGPPQGQNYSQGGPPPGSGMYPMGNQGQGNYPMGNPQYPMGGPGMPPTSGPIGGAPTGMATGAGQNTAGKPAKKGFLDIIRDWFR